MSAMASNRVDCIGIDPFLTKYTLFYVLKASPSFSICSPCYRRHVVPNHSVQYEFTPYHSDDPDEAFTCDISVPSVIAILKTQCIPRSTIQPLLDFTQLCTTLQPCDGSVITSGGGCYVAARRAIPGMTVCQTCFECFLRHTRFEKDFIFDSTARPSWTCTLSMPFFQRLTTTALSKSTAITAFCEEARTRLEIPICPGRDRAITQFLSKVPNVIFNGENGNGNICFACYCDYLANTRLEQTFVPARLAPDQLGRVTCDLAHPYSRMAMEVAVQRGNVNVWRESVTMAGEVGVCPGISGMDEGEMSSPGTPEWYCVSGAEQVQICANCYWLKAKLYGAGHLFQPIRRSLTPGVVRMCSLSASNGTGSSAKSSMEDTLVLRGRRLLQAIRPGYEAGDWILFSTVTREMNREPPPCAGSQRGFFPASGRRWFGRARSSGSTAESCTIIICEDCYWRAVQGLPYAHLFGQDMSQRAYSSAGATGVLCQASSSTTREMLRSTTTTGDLGRFARWWNRPDEVQSNSYPTRVQLPMSSIRPQATDAHRLQQLRLRLNEQRNALSRMGAAGTVDLANGDPGVRWGSSSVGWGHWTKGSADAQQDWQNINRSGM